MKTKKISVAVMSSLYVALVSLIPLFLNSGKGSTLNTFAKLLIFALFALVVFNRANFKLDTTISKIYIIISFVLSQLLCYIWNNSLNVISSLAQALLLIIIFIPLNNVRESNKEIEKGIKIFLIFNFFAIIYNFIKHFRNIINLNFITNIRYDMYSFFDNKNTYGMILFVALALLFYYRTINKHFNKKLFVFLVTIQIFSITMSLCRTALLCTGVFLVLVFLLDFSKFKLGLLIFLTAVIFLLLQIPSVNEFVLYHVLRIDTGTYRDGIYSGSRQLISQSLLFGFGEDNFANILASITGNMYPHNGLYTVLLDGGLIYLSGYIILYFVLIKRAISVIKVNRKLGTYVLFFLICTIIYACFEGIVVCGSSSANFAFCLAAYIIPSIFSVNERY